MLILIVAYQVGILSQQKAISLTLCLDDNMGTTDTSRDSSTFWLCT